MATISSAQQRTILRALGWRIRTTNEHTQVVKNFQRGYNLGTKLTVDGDVGPATSAALLRSYAAKKAGRPTASAHFSFSEFACKCGGRYSSCQRIWVRRGLLVSLEKYREHQGSVKIISGCRCPSHNRAVGGSTKSQHMSGCAADIHSPYTVNRVKQWDLFAGLGYAGSNSQVRHVDRRDLSGSPSTIYHPMTWVYSNW